MPSERVGVSSESCESGWVVRVDGDLAAVATLLQLRSVLRSLVFSDDRPLVIDLTGATGSSSAVHRLVERTIRVAAHRGLTVSVATA